MLKYFTWPDGVTNIDSFTEREVDKTALKEKCVGAGVKYIHPSQHESTIETSECHD
jgi:hypothetical protein